MAEADRGRPPLDRPGLRRALLAAHAWLADTDVGPQAVVAGECDRCAEEPRLVQPCGPPPAGVTSPDWGLGRRCAAAVGPDGWCEGHGEEAAAVLERLAALPPEADDVARLWWVATGEVRPGSGWTPARAALPGDP